MEDSPLCHRRTAPLPQRQEDSPFCRRHKSGGQSPLSQGQEWRTAPLLQRQEDSPFVADTRVEDNPLCHRDKSGGQPPYYRDKRTVPLSQTQEWRTIPFVTGTREEDRERHDVRHQRGYLRQLGQLRLHLDRRGDRHQRRGDGSWTLALKRGGAFSVSVKDPVTSSPPHAVCLREDQEELRRVKGDWATLKRGGAFSVSVRSPGHSQCTQLRAAVTPSLSRPVQRSPLPRPLLMQSAYEKIRMNYGE